MACFFMFLVVILLLVFGMAIMLFPETGLDLAAGMGAAGLFEIH